MARVDISIVFDDAELSPLNAFKIYQGHVKKKVYKGSETFWKVMGLTFTAVTLGDSNDYDNPEYVRIDLWNPEINEVD